MELVALTDHNKLNLNLNQNVEFSKNVSEPKSYSVRLLEEHEMLALKVYKHKYSLFSIISQ